MTFGFPAHHGEVIDIEDDRVTARKAICQAFDELEWRYELIDVDNYRSWVRFSGESWEKKFEVSLLDDGMMKIVSTCRLPTQCLDFGKNRRNVERFLETFKMKCIGVRRSAQPASPTIDELGRSPLDRLIRDESY
jgi:hypothetical protein